jgi:predicted nucleic acid-binding protein
LIALDASSFARLLDGLHDRASDAAREALGSRLATLPPIVLTELLSNPNITTAASEYVATIPLLPLLEGYWSRAAILRADLLRRGFKAEVADCLIAQSCIDHDIPLITYDRDFRHFIPAGLQLL